MFSCAKFQKDSFIRSIVSPKNVKRTFLSPEPLPDDFSNILFYGDMVNNGTCLCVEFHSRRPRSLWGVESQRIHKSERIRASLAPLNNAIKNTAKYLFEALLELLILPLGKNMNKITFKIIYLLTFFSKHISNIFFFTLMLVLFRYGF